MDGGAGELRLRGAIVDVVDEFEPVAERVVGMKPPEVLNGVVLRELIIGCGEPDH